MKGRTAESYRSVHCGRKVRVETRAGVMLLDAACQAM